LEENEAAPVSSKTGSWGWTAGFADLTHEEESLKQATPTVPRRWLEKEGSGTATEEVKNLQGKCGSWSWSWRANLTSLSEQEQHLQPGTTAAGLYYIMEEGECDEHKSDDTVVTISGYEDVQCVHAKYYYARVKSTLTRTGIQIDKTTMRNPWATN
jgi:hypothetical protein